MAQSRDAAAPRSAFRLEDGVTNRAWTHAGYALVERDSVSNLLATGSVTPAPPPTPAAWSVVDTIRVNASTFLLTTPIYTNLVSLPSDTVFIFDAQQDEARARSDSAWSGKLFPGRHPLVLVVIDLAWPHIGGVRYWVANGVPIITHRMSRSFLEEVINRRWTLKPDLLEQRRASTKVNMRVSCGEEMDRPPTLSPHRSGIVNLARIRELVPQPTGELSIVLDSGERVPLGRHFRAAFLARFGGDATT